jgi:hypothetical protein
VHDNLPEFTMKNGLITTAAFAIMWQIEFEILKIFLNYVTNNCQKLMPSLKNVQALSARDRIYYASYYHGIVHAIFSTIGALYALVYADGQPGTTWFHCPHYHMTMFDVQKYLNLMTVGYLLQDLVFCVLK